MKNVIPPCACMFVILALLSPVAKSLAEDPETPADTVYTNGKIYTVDETRPWAEAVAIKDGKFIVVGSAADARRAIAKGTKVIDLAGKFAMPGLHDQHVHIEQSYKGEILGEKLLTFPSEIDTAEKAAKLLKEFAAKNSDSEVLFGQNLK